MKSYHRHPPQQAPTHQEADEPVFRPLRRFNWVPVRKRPPRYHSPLVTCRRTSQSALAAGGAPCGGYSNDAFAVCFRSEPPEHPNEREVASDGVVRRRHLPPPPPRLRPPRCVVDTEVVEPKHCCGVLVTQTVSIRWFIVMIAFVGLCCAIVGTVLGALKATGREHLTVSLLMIVRRPEQYIKLR
ncbi:hypothetical protein IscW_ISCW006178 [Ixodes scapularis]|uniref:Uncharacterized protein n=1 Tax=Ixodes scapularis TaxID=6945 RepID=B7PQA3_IXOSC|nr:hypothetical protein IscW_ISCW006178 [Ixodes scapularis]|eukprot:XP_002435945.1 hypothetical protein IscW_ISCW006178 [Ixodes scapularis]